MKPDEGHRFSRAAALGLLGGAVGVLAARTGSAASGCAVGPAYHRPAPVISAALTMPR